VIAFAFSHLESFLVQCLQSFLLRNKDEKPLSLLIVAKPESGKTLVLKKYRENKGIVYLTDCTAYGLTRDILPKVISGEIRHILIADLITPLSKSAKTIASCFPQQSDRGGSRKNDDLRNCLGEGGQMWNDLGYH